MNGYRAIGGWQRAKAMPVSVAWVAASISIGVAGLAAKQRQMGLSICFDHPENWSDLVAKLPLRMARWVIAAIGLGRRDGVWPTSFVGRRQSRIDSAGFTSMFFWWK